VEAPPGDDQEGGLGRAQVSPRGAEARHTEAPLVHPPLRRLSGHQGHPRSPRPPRAGHRIQEDHLTLRPPPRPRQR
jgi:hypothetical protein